MAGEIVQVSQQPVPVWPEGQRVLSRDKQRTILRTVFTDTEAYHPALIARVLEMAQDPRWSAQYSRSLGGTKLYHLDQWDSAEAQLLNERAKALFRLATGDERAVVDIAWVNVYRKGDYIAPHSHTRSTASLVYCLDAGEEDPEDINAGRFCFVDPRYPDCCQIEEQRMTNPLQPEMRAGTLLLFPSELVHCVNPYGGNRPRITVSWNMNAVPLPGSPLEPFLPKA
ncbi:MAG: 2OG-Fe(II) oxygenase family protein [Kiloniellales bacterium]|nr:2OG-Fe(II) oxygenase family protein [Kiloniellales bacterium]